eukprot:jgi/Chrzof1/3657/Cz13g04010.t1
MLQRWDAAQCSPQLLDLISSGALTVAGKRVLVPGCGRGYDVIAFAQAGAAASIGLEISPVGVREASAYVQQQLPPELAPQAQVLEADFFTYQDPGGPFDIGYDYTFLCALHPDMRKDWATAWGKHLKPGGELVTLIFPVDPSADANLGPPWPVTPELYTQLLADSGWECVHLSPVPSHLSHPGRVGKEWLGCWKRMFGNSDEGGGAGELVSTAKTKL